MPDERVVLVSGPVKVTVQLRLFLRGGETTRGNLLLRHLLPQWPPLAGLPALTLLKTCGLAGPSTSRNPTAPFFSRPRL